jgi:hypothetical protein
MRKHNIILVELLNFLVRVEFEPIFALISRVKGKRFAIGGEKFIVLV